MFQQVLDSTASLRLEEKDLQDAASILSEDPSVNLAVDAILLSTPLYQKVYKKSYPIYSSPLPVNARPIKRKEVGHIRGSSTESSARSSKERPVDPYYAENLGLPFLGIPFHGEAPMPSLEEDSEVEEHNDNAEINEGRAEEKVLQNYYLNHSSRPRTAPTDNIHTVDGTAKLSNDKAKISRSSGAIQPVNDGTEAVVLDSGPSACNQQSVQKQHRPITQDLDTIPKKVAESSPSNHPSSGSSTSSKPSLPTSPVNAEVPSQTGCIESNELLVQNSGNEGYVPASATAKHLPLIPSVPAESFSLSGDKTGPQTTAQNGVCEEAPSTRNKNFFCSVNSSSEQYIDVEPFEINFGPEPSLDIPDLQPTMNYDKGLLDYESPKSGTAKNIIEDIDEDLIHSIASKGSVSQNSYALKGAPPKRPPPPIPTMSPSGWPNGRETMEDRVDSGRIEYGEMISKSVDGTTSVRKMGTWSKGGNDSISSLRSQTPGTTASAADLTAETEANSLGSLPKTSLQHDAQAGIQQIQIEDHNIKSKRNIQSARDAVSNSIALIQRKYLPDTKSHTPSPRRLPKLSSMSRLSVSSVFKQSEKNGAVHAAAAIGNSQQLIWLLQENAKLANTHSVQLSSGGISEQRTPLMCAAINGHVYCMEVLRKYGADLTTTDKKGKTALHLAVEAGQVDPVTSLVKLATEAGSTGQGACLIKLLEASDKDGSKPLHIAATSGAFDILKTLVAAGADLDAKGNLGKTPLHCAVIERQDIIATNLISRGATIDALDVNRLTPLMLAVKWNVLAINYLLQGGADKTVRDTSGNTVIHHAARLGHLRAIELLGPRLEDLEVRNNLGERPLHLAASHNNKNVVVDLLKRGVDVNPWSTPPTSKAASFNFVPTTIREGAGGLHLTLSATPLHYACYNGCYDSSEALLEHGAWLNAALEDAQTSLMLAVQAQNFPLVSLLLRKGARVNAANSKDCLTALHYACATGDLEITKLLVSHGANARALSASSVPENPAAYGIRLQRKYMAGARLEAARYVIELPLETSSPAPAIDNICYSVENSPAAQFW